MVDAYGNLARTAHLFDHPNTLLLYGQITIQDETVAAGASILC
jgi:hypothetical protein